MHLRNEIVHLEMRLREGKAKEVIDELRLEHIVTKEGLHPNFLKKVLPPIEKLINTIHSATPLEQSYFCHFLTFLSRELFLSKWENLAPTPHVGLHAYGMPTSLQNSCRARFLST